MLRIGTERDTTDRLVKGRVSKLGFAVKWLASCWFPFKPSTEQKINDSGSYPRPLYLYQQLEHVSISRVEQVWGVELCRLCLKWAASPAPMRGPASVCRPQVLLAQVRMCVDLFFLAVSVHLQTLSLSEGRRPADS